MNFAKKTNNHSIFSSDSVSPQSEVNDIAIKITVPSHSHGVAPHEMK
jgi:hypothetical protein